MPRRVSSEVRSDELCVRSLKYMLLGLGADSDAEVQNVRGCTKSNLKNE